MAAEQVDTGNVYQGSPYRRDEQKGTLPVAGGEGRFSPVSIIRMILNYWKIVFLCSLLGGLGGILYLRHTVPVYKIEAQVQMSVRQPKVVINRDSMLDDSSTGRDEGSVFYTRFKKFKSPAMEQLATQTYFDSYPSDESTGSNGGVSRSELAGIIRDVQWYKDPKADIVTVYYLCSDPEFGAKLVNVLTDCAEVLMMQENKAQSEVAVKWLVTQVEETRELLDDFESRQADLRAELHLDSLLQRKSELDQSLLSVSAEREALISTVASRMAVFEFVKKLQGTDPDLELLPPGLPKEEQLSDLLQKWRSAKDELELMSSRYTPLHPECKQAAAAEARARDQLDKFIDLSVKAVENEIGLLNQQVEQIDARIETIRSESLDLEQKVVSGNRKLQSLESKRAVADASYQSMLRRVEEARLASDQNMAFTKVIQAATVPRDPVGPDKPKILLGCIFLGVAIGSLISIAVSLILDKVDTINELRAMGLNVLGIIPLQKKLDIREELATIGLKDKFNHIVETFAGINSLLTADRFCRKSRVIVVCSGMAGEGKTIVACNLAISSAQKGVRTLLIDGDLRRPQIAKVFMISKNHPSLLEWLCTDEPGSHESLISGNVVKNLDVISSRPFAEINPAELLGRPQLTELLEWAAMHYDRVIIDSPPIGAVGDVQALAIKADSVLLVARLGKCRRRLLRFALNRFHDLDVNVLGCIANDVPNTLMGMFSGAEGYGYGYGYRAYKSDAGN
ncbi:MAG: polysaccharide biosynthesis tyrosine autokinase [Pontiellaceae bacterium]|nr:polysaccharide biosynthesis tyrosine autokinase [Pontiellaceae bacterium]MBN2783924.1 polysaccharide biosynthesis tyrosine autokinase [Pontiellaceae bacterium]